MRPSPLDPLPGTPQLADLHLDQSRNVISIGELDGLNHPSYLNGPIAAPPHSHQPAMLHERLGRGSATSAPVRRRISRACDQCNQLRTRCDGEKPVSIFIAYCA